MSSDAAGSNSAPAPRNGAPAASPCDRLTRLRELLLPCAVSVSIATSPPSSDVGSGTSFRQEADRNGDQKDRSGTLDLDELRPLLFRGVPEAPQAHRGTADTSANGPGEESALASPGHLRPLAWRLALGVLQGDSPGWTGQLERLRSQYRRWKCDFVGGTASQRAGGGARTDEEHRGDMFLMKEIDKVCARMAGLQQMLYILFVFAKLHPDVGYIQGMNEILAPIIYVCSADPVADWVCEAEADAFHCFAAVLASFRVLYGRAPHDPLKSGADTQMARLTQLLRQHDAILWQHLLLREGFTAALRRLQTLQTNGIDIEQVLQTAEKMREIDRRLDEARQRTPSDLRETQKKLSIPENWTDVPKMGALIGTSRFLPMRVPLDDKYTHLLKASDDLWSPQRFLEAQAAEGHDVRMVIDLTNTFKYYDGVSEFADSPAEYVKLKIEGFRGPPAAHDVARFMEIVDAFVAKEPVGAIAVHCTHGLNRTGYLIVNYMVERQGCTVAEALAAFAVARPPGLIKHMYVEELFKRLGPSEDVQLPELPDWAADKYGKRKH
ncbi:hypothetical protein BBJ28_00002760 [Nothophytophthora sp. Chile5]|nr:hypothetical protein BBJ28_00002760 [Nothophytophthora sp. Chile5]